MNFLRIEKKSLLLGKSKDKSYVYIPLPSVIEIRETGADITVYYRGLKNEASSICLENSNITDVLSEANVIEL